MARIVDIFGRSALSPMGVSETGTESGGTDDSTTVTASDSSDGGASFNENLEVIPVMVVVTSLENLQEPTNNGNVHNSALSMRTLEVVEVPSSYETTTAAEAVVTTHSSRGQTELATAETAVEVARMPSALELELDDVRATLAEVEDLKERVKQYDEGIDYFDDKVDKLEQRTVDALGNVGDIFTNCLEETVVPMRHELNDTKRNVVDMVKILMEVRASTGELGVEQNSNKKTTRNLKLLEDAHSATDEMVGRVVKDIGVLFEDQRRLRKSMKRTTELVRDWSGYRSSVRAAFMGVKVDASVLKSHLTGQGPAVAALLERFEASLEELWGTIEDSDENNDDIDSEASTKKKRKKSDP